VYARTACMKGGGLKVFDVRDYYEEVGSLGRRCLVPRDKFKDGRHG